jgi:hypothetical protein
MFDYYLKLRPYKNTALDDYVHGRLADNRTPHFSSAVLLGELNLDVWGEALSVTSTSVNGSINLDGKLVYEVALPFEYGVFHQQYNYVLHPDLVTHWGNRYSIRRNYNSTLRLNLHTRNSDLRGISAKLEVDRWGMKLHLSRKVRFRWGTYYEKIPVFSVAGEVDKHLINRPVLYQLPRTYLFR